MRYHLMLSIRIGFLELIKKQEKIKGVYGERRNE